MTPTLERLARRLCSEFSIAARPYGEAAYEHDQYVTDHWRSFVPLAVAACLELRDPDEGMLAAGAKRIFQPGQSWGKCARDAWQAMIDAALGDSK